MVGGDTILGLPHLDLHSRILSFLAGFHPLLELAGVTRRRRHATKLGGQSSAPKYTHMDGNGMTESEYKAVRKEMVKWK